MNLLSEEFPYWAYIPSDQTLWNKKSGLYLLVPNNLNHFFKNEILIIPYHFENKTSPFNPHKCIHLIIEQYVDIKNFSFHHTDTFQNFQLLHIPSFNEYKNKFDFIKLKLHRGDIYEINFCLEFYLNLADTNPIALFNRIYERTRAPYSILVRLNNKLLLCFSPELFLKREDQKLITEPIKGTLKKGGKNNQHKIKIFSESIKEKAENAMAVDVARNDFSRIASWGSVRVPELFTVKELKNIIQMYSRVECNIKDKIDWFDILSATFPMASMTGAPKISAMEIIRQTEDFDRGFYSGSIGIFNTPEDAVLNVVIRTIEYDILSKKGRICTGSAITWKSEAKKEYNECLLKMKSILQKIN